MELINKSSIIQFSWNFVTNINPFLSAIFKAKYCPNTSFWTTNTTGPRSVYWSSILQVKHHLHANTILQIHAGNSSTWFTPWIDSWTNIHDNLILPVTNLPLPSTVSDLWLQGTEDWNHQLLSTTFSPEVVQAITSIHVVSSTEIMCCDGFQQPMVNVPLNSSTLTYNISTTSTNFSLQEHLTSG